MLASWENIRNRSVKVLRLILKFGALNYTFFLNDSADIVER